MSMERCKVLPWKPEELEQEISRARSQQQAEDEAARADVVVHAETGAGKTHTLFLTSGGEVWACGSNKFGELGLSSIALFSNIF